jgi:hypothetical protein
MRGKGRPAIVESIERVQNACNRRLVTRVHRQPRLLHLLERILRLGLECLLERRKEAAHCELAELEVLVSVEPAMMVEA